MFSFAKFGGPFKRATLGLEVKDEATVRPVVPQSPRMGETPFRISQENAFPDPFLNFWSSICISSPDFATKLVRDHKSDSVAALIPCDLITSTALPPQLKWHSDL